MKSVRVVAAIIEKDKRILATQRGYGEFEGGWEFPGGKIEPHEKPEDALVREIHEELNTEIAVIRFITNVQYDYESFHLDMDCYLCSLLDETFELCEHHAARWLDADLLNSVEWLPADIEILDTLREQEVV
ncbi:MAG: (deoxy)nucleoside triphosphate pyrophosphohydrolase [Atopobiaceae bacterium]|nr:(deoxy)nucleoside triphosphate pyrophosphohydrolase [Atopobiaceae bacterium]